MTIEQVVTKGQANGLPIDELLSNQEGLRQFLRLRLFLIGDIETSLKTISQKLLKGGKIPRCRDQQDVLHSSQHQDCKRIIDHWLVVDWNELLAHRMGHWEQPAPRSTGENYPFPHCESVGPEIRVIGFTTDHRCD